MVEQQRSQRDLLNYDKSESIRKLKMLTFIKSPIAKTKVDILRNNQKNKTLILINSSLSTFYFFLAYSFVLLVSAALLGGGHTSKVPTVFVYYLFVPVLGVFAHQYWHNRSQYGDQWKYCADLYNKLHGDFFTEDSKFLVYWFNRINLCFDLMEMTLEYHKSYSNFFEETLEITSNFLNVKKPCHEVGLVMQDSLRKNDTERAMLYNFKCQLYLMALSINNEKCDNKTKVINIIDNGSSENNSSEFLAKVLNHKG